MVNTVFAKKPPLANLVEDRKTKYHLVFFSSLPLSKSLAGSYISHEYASNSLIFIMKDTLNREFLYNEINDETT